MNRYSAPWRVLPLALLIIYFMMSCAVIGVFSISNPLHLNRDSVVENTAWFLGVGGIVSVLAALVSYAIVLSVYGKAHLHTSTVAEIWTERRMYEDADFKTLMASDDAHTIYLMKLASSSRDIYTIEDANTESLIRPGALVTIRRRLTTTTLRDNHSWRATTVAVTPPEQVVAPLPTE